MYYNTGLDLFITVHLDLYIRGTVSVIGNCRLHPRKNVVHSFYLKEQEGNYTIYFQVY